MVTSSFLWVFVTFCAFSSFCDFQIYRYAAPCWGGGGALFTYLSILQKRKQPYHHQTFACAFLFNFAHPDLRNFCCPARMAVNSIRVTSRSVDFGQKQRCAGIVVESTVLSIEPVAFTKRCKMKRAIKLLSRMLDFLTCF